MHRSLVPASVHEGECIMRMIKLKLFITVAAAVFAFICIGAVNQTNAHAATAPNVKAEMRNPGGGTNYKNAPVKVK